MISLVEDLNVEIKMTKEEQIQYFAHSISSYRQYTSEMEIISFLRREGYDFGVTLPCSKFSNLLKIFNGEHGIKIVPVTREEEGVGVCAGAYLAGKKPFMLIQSSGLGNSLNALASLIKAYQIPLLILASYRGFISEKISAQVPLGISLPRILEAMRIRHLILRKNFEDVKLLGEHFFVNDEVCVILLSPELFENA